MLMSHNKPFSCKSITNRFIQKLSSCKTFCNCELKPIYPFDIDIVIVFCGYSILYTASSEFSIQNVFKGMNTPKYFTIDNSKFVVSTSSIANWSLYKSHKIPNFVIAQHTAYIFLLIGEQLTEEDVFQAYYKLYIEIVAVFVVVVSTIPFSHK